MLKSRSNICVLIAILNVMACNEVKFGSENRKAKTDSDGRRPSEEGEGLIGYLHDPASLRYERTDQVIRIAGGENAVIVAGGNPEGFLICLQALNPDSLSKYQSSNDPFDAGAVVDLGETIANADGSFQIEAPIQLIPSDHILSLNLTVQCRKQTNYQVRQTNQIILFSSNMDGNFIDFLTLDSADRDSLFSNTDAKSPASAVKEDEDDDDGSGSKSIMESKGNNDEGKWAEKSKTVDE